MERVDVDIGLEGTHCLVTGGAGMIGSHVVSALLSAGANVSCLDISRQALDVVSDRLKELHLEAIGNFHPVQVDITDEDAIQRAFEEVVGHFGLVQCCVALASLDLSVLVHHNSICDMPASQWQQTQQVNVFGTFLTARTWARFLRSSTHSRLRNISLIIVGSESGSFGERGNADYAASKSAVQGGLLQSLKMDLPRVYPGARQAYNEPSQAVSTIDGVTRVNVIAPGAVATPKFEQECTTNPRQLWHDAEATTALGKPVSMSSVARGVIYLASENYSGNVHGQVLAVDSGKSGKLVFEEGEARKFR